MPIILMLTEEVMWQDRVMVTLQTQIMRYKEIKHDITDVLKMLRILIGEVR